MTDKTQQALEALKDLQTYHSDGGGWSDKRFSIVTAALQSQPEAPEPVKNYIYGTGVGLVHGSKEAITFLSNQHALVAIPQWQPIETAPRDGTEILIAFGCGDGDVPPPLVCAWDDKVSGWLLVGLEVEITTAASHWMPLPAPPEMKEG